MKSLLIAVIIAGSGLLNTTIAAEHINDPAGKEKIGVVSASNAYILSDLSAELSKEADEKGATSYKILSTTDDKRLHGVAEINNSLAESVL